VNPWHILGWLLVILLAPAVIIFVGKIVFAIGELVVALLKDVRRSYRLRRANKGKVKCELKGCVNIATRRTKGGFRCEEHLRDEPYARISFAFLLDHYKDEFARRKEDK